PLRPSVASRSHPRHVAFSGSRRCFYVGDCYRSLLFFFQSSGDHRDLHSFPTRRSSDLGKDSLVEIVSMLVGLIKSNSPDRLHEEDRKSTRLNSSHQIISYAVFCLKKKRKSDAYRSRYSNRWTTPSSAFSYSTDGSTQPH